MITKLECAGCGGSSFKKHKIEGFLICENCGNQYEHNIRKIEEELPVDLKEITKGDYNDLILNNCIITGDYNDIKGNHNIIKGDYNDIKGINNIAFGDYNSMKIKK